MRQTRLRRRLAAIMAVDAVGYSRLMERDEAGTHARFMAHRRELVDPAVRFHGGRIVKSTGDGVLAEFSSAVEAVAAAVRIQRRLLDLNAAIEDDKKVTFRIGLNVGDLILDEGDIYGDGVNVAVRLEALAAPGGICISGAVQDQIRDKLPYAFMLKGEHRLKNIARLVDVYELDGEAVAGLAPVSDLPVGSIRRHRAAAAAALAGLGLAAAGAWWVELPSSEPPAGAAQPVAFRPDVGKALQPQPEAATDKARLSIVVLPFTNLGEDIAQDYFTDGITEDLTTDLSRIPGSLVIARNTAFTYKGRAVDVRQIGRELGVRYVLEGSVRRTGTSVRVNAQLIDTDTGAHVWADRFDDDMQHMLRLQDRVTSRIARSLDLQLVEAESRRAELERPTHPDATDLAMRGWAFLNRARSRDNTLNAVALFEQALAIDPDHVRAGLGLARASYFMKTQRLVDDPEPLLEKAERIARRAVALDPDSGLAHNVLSDVLTGRKQLEAALAEMRRAVEINRNDAGAWGSIGYQLAMLGRFEEAQEPLQRAIQISPRDPSLWVWRMWTGLRHVALGAQEEGIGWLRSAVEANPQAYLLFFYYGGVAGLMGREEEARAAVETMQRLRPGVTLARLKAESPSDHPSYLAFRERLLDGLRRAGLPD